LVLDGDAEGSAFGAVIGAAGGVGAVGNVVVAVFVGRFGEIVAWDWVSLNFEERGFVIDVCYGRAGLRKHYENMGDGYYLGTGGAFRTSR